MAELEIQAELEEEEAAQRRRWKKYEWEYDEEPDWVLWCREMWELHGDDWKDHCVEYNPRNFRDA